MQYAPTVVGNKQPSTMVSKGFTFSNGKLNLQLTLERELFYHGEEVRFNVNVKNDSKKTVKGLMVNQYWIHFNRSESVDWTRIPDNAFETNFKLIGRLTLS